MNPSLLHIMAAGGCKHTFLGLIPWYQYLQTDGQCNINNFQLLTSNGQHSQVPLVLLAVVQDLITIAGLAAVIFVIIGGIRYSTSQGNPDQAAKARSTIINALIGLAITITAVAFTSFLGKSLS